MAYISSHGAVQGQANFSIVKTFWKLIYFLMFFFRSLLGPIFGDNNRNDPDSQARYRSNMRGNGRDGWGGGGGGGGGGWRPGGGGGGGPRRPMGRLNTDGASSMPSCPMGGCCR